MFYDYVNYVTLGYLLDEINLVLFALISQHDIKLVVTLFGLRVQYWVWLSSELTRIGAP